MNRDILNLFVLLDVEFNLYQCLEGLMKIRSHSITFNRLVIGTLLKIVHKQLNKVYELL